MSKAAQYSNMATYGHVNGYTCVVFHMGCINRFHWHCPTECDERRESAEDEVVEGETDHIQMCTRRTVRMAVENGVAG